MTRHATIYAILAFALTACGQPDNQVAPVAPNEGPAPQAAATPEAASETPAPEPAAIANPASTHCIDRGGKLEIHNGPGGQFGVCVFDDGSRCEEWAYFRGECAPGQCTAPDGRCE